MTKEYLIMFNAGYGEEYSSIEADSLEEATEFAYEEWRQAVESQADYYAKEMTDELREDYL